MRMALHGAVDRDVHWQKCGEVEASLGWITDGDLGKCRLMAWSNNDY